MAKCTRTRAPPTAGFGRLQLGISRGSPEQVIEGYRYFGYVPADCTDQADMAREHTRAFLDALKGNGFAEPNPRPMFEQGCFELSRTPTGCASGFGGAREPGGPPSGR